MVIKDTLFGRKLIHLPLRSIEVQWIDMFMGRHSYLRYSVIYIAFITIYFPPELYYLTLLNLFIGCYFDSLPT